jgi:type IV secretory pathway VirB10-like protein
MSDDLRDTEVTSASALREATGGAGRTDAREPTDVHRTKIPPDDPRLRIERPRSRTLRRGPAIGVLLMVIGVGCIALAIAFNNGSSPSDTKSQSSADEVNTSSVTLPEVIKDPPASSDEPAKADRSVVPGPRANAKPDASGSYAARTQARAEEMTKARGSSLFAPMDDALITEKVGSAALSSGGGAATPASAGTASPAGGDASRSPDPNLQDRENDFLAKAGASSAEYLERTLTLPLSPYELKAGTVIPTVLITGINSDLPGKVVGQVRENVYDSVSGNHLLVPQGSRLIAAYDSMVAWGQERVLVCWQRLIRPDGSSIALECMPGVDLAGYAGFADEVDNHWWKIITGAAFSSLLAATAQRSQGDVTSFQPTFPQVWASNAAGQINQAGQQLTQKNLQIQPTITVRPGFSVNVLVSKDIVLPPYRRSAAAP